MPKYEVLATQVIYLSTFVESESEDKAWQIAIDEGSWKDYEADPIQFSNLIQIKE